MKKCNLCDTYATHETFDVVGMQWHPVCNEHLELMRALFQASDRMFSELPEPMKSQVRHVSTEERIRLCR